MVARIVCFAVKCHKEKLKAKFHFLFTFKEGITACHKAECNCSDEKVDFDCCPHCDESSKCYHPDTTLTFQNGEQWKFQCETCECLV